MCLKLSREFHTRAYSRTYREEKNQYCITHYYPLRVSPMLFLSFQANCFVLTETTWHIPIFVPAEGECHPQALRHISVRISKDLADGDCLINSGQ